MSERHEALLLSVQPSPILPRAYGLNSAWGDPELLGKGLVLNALLVGATDFAHLVFSKNATGRSLPIRALFGMCVDSVSGAIRTRLGVKMRRVAAVTQKRKRLRVRLGRVPVTAGHSVLCGSVSHIVSIATGKQVVGAHAASVIATVTDTRLISGQGPVRDEVGKTVGRKALVLDAKGTVTVPFATSPFPALAGLVHLRPEALNVFCGKLNLHGEPPAQVSCATAPAVSAARGHSLAQSIAQTFGGV